MIEVLRDDDYSTSINIIHWISEFDLEHMRANKEQIIDAEIELEREEAKEHFPDFDVIFSYPQRKAMMPPKDENYEKAINNLQDMGFGEKGLKVITRIHKYN